MILNEIIMTELQDNNRFRSFIFPAKIG